MAISAEQVAALQGLVRWHLGRHYEGHPEWEELLAEAYLGMWRAVSRVPDAQGSRLTTTATRGALWAAQDWLRSGRSSHRRESRKGGALPRLVSLEAIEEGFGEGGAWRLPAEPDFVPALIEALEGRAVVERMRRSRRLSAVRRAILERVVMADEPPLGVARELGLSLGELLREREAALAVLRAEEREAGDVDGE